MPIETTATVVAEVPDDAELLAVPYASDLSPGVELHVPAPDLLAHYEAKGAAGEIVEVPVSRAGGVGRVLLYGVGDGSPKALRTAAAALTRKAK
ncbi:leucyl aminopeptidase, partial [Nonomuraea sp. NPDC004297]